MSIPGGIDLDKPRYDQNTFEGRARHFLQTTNPLLAFATDADLERSKAIVLAYRAWANQRDHPSCSTAAGSCCCKPTEEALFVLNGLTEDDIWRAKILYDSAFHPQTGEKQFLMGRMSFQVFGNTFIVAGMLTFYRSTPAVVFWHWLNQSYMATVNFTNRNTSGEQLSQEQLLSAYLGATAASVATALTFNRIIAYAQLRGVFGKGTAGVGGLMAKLVPLVAVAAANCVNIPAMRQQELRHGIELETEEGLALDEFSVSAAYRAIFTQVLPSRVAMACPAMLVPPVLIALLERQSRRPGAGVPLLVRRPALKLPAMIVLTGLSFALSTPLCCALFPQRARIAVSDLEAPLQKRLEQRFPGRTQFFYNKGL